MSLIMDPVSPFSHSTSSTHTHHHQQQQFLTSTPNRHRHPSQQQPSAFTPANRVNQHRTESRSRSTSIANPARLESILPDQIREELPHSPARSSNPNWSSPHNSPRPHPFLEPVPSTANPSAWVPTPPRSDSGVASIPLHAVAPSMNPASPHPPSHFVPTTSAAPMSQVNYGMPAQYGPLGIDEASLHGSSYHFDQGYRQSMQQPPVSHSYDFSQADTYGTSAMRTSSPMPMQQAYGEEYRLAGAYDMNRSHTGDSIPRPLPSTTLASNASNYASSAYQRSPTMYDNSVYGHHSIPPAQPMPGQLQGNLNYGQPMYNASSMSSLPRSMSSVSADSIRGSSQKPKPQCWEHGCNGRKFSTFSNLLRHQREKSGTASKSYCPKCGAEFTRTTARNGHLAHDKCTKQRKSSSEGRT